MTDNQRTNQRPLSKKISHLALMELQMKPEELDEITKNPSLLVDTGYDYMELGEYAKALQLFSLGAMINGNDPEILNGLGIVLCELGRYQKSKEVLEHSVRLNPEDEVTAANLAGVCWEMGEPEQAIYYYHRSLEINPNIAEIHYNLVNLYIETGALYMAYIACLNFLERFPDNTEARELLNEILINLAIASY